MKLKDIVRSLKGGSSEDIEIPPRDEWPTHIQHVDGEEFQGFIKRYPVVLIDFHSPTCAPCRAMRPRLRKLSKEYERKAVFGKVNIDENKKLADEYDILSVPTFIIFENGKQTKYLKGKLPLSELKKSLDDVLDYNDF